jgi:dolichol-phosphate mannosyltransferase
VSATTVAPPAAPPAVRADYFVSVVAPLHDDAAIAREFVTDVVGVLRANYLNYELVLVDDGSEDDTPRIMSELLTEHGSLRYVRLSRDYGEEIAITAGLDTVIGDVVVVMLPNSDPPALIPQFVQKARSGAGVVFGIRNQRTGEGPLTRGLVRLWYAYSGRVLKLRVPRDSSQFRALSRPAVNAVVRIRDRYRYLRVISGDIGYQATGIRYDQILRNPRRRGRTLLQRARTTLDIIVSNSTHPLRSVTYLGLLASLANLAWAASATVRGSDDLAGPGHLATLPLQLAFMFVIIMLVLTVIGEYVGQAHAEARDRPLYHVLEERDSPVRMVSESRRNVVTESVAE